MIEVLGEVRAGGGTDQAMADETGGKRRPRRRRMADGVMSLRERQKLERRGRMLSAARLLFNEHGYAQVTIEDIAVEAEVSSATVHNYYATKGQLLLALVADGDEAIHAFAVRLAAEPLPSAFETLDGLLAKTTQHSLECLGHKVWRHAIAISIARDDPEYGTGFAEIHQRFVTSYQAVIAALQTAGRLDAGLDAGMLASVVYKLQHALFVELIGDADMDVASHLARQAEHLRLVLRQG